MCGTGLKSSQKVVGYSNNIHAIAMVISCQTGYHCRPEGSQLGRLPAEFSLVVGTAFSSAMKASNRMKPLGQNKLDFFMFHDSVSGVFSNRVLSSSSVW